MTDQDRLYELFPRQDKITTVKVNFSLPIVEETSLDEPDIFRRQFSVIGYHYIRHGETVKWGILKTVKRSRRIFPYYIK